MKILLKKQQKESMLALIEECATGLWDEVYGIRIKNIEWLSIYTSISLISNSFTTRQDILGFEALLNKQFSSFNLNETLKVNTNLAVFLLY